MTKPAETELCQPQEPRKPHPNPLGLHEGWVAAERGEPFDLTQALAWQEGHRLRKQYPPRR